MAIAIRDRRIWAGLAAIGAIAAVIAAVWSRGAYEGEASARVFGPAAPIPAETTPPRKLAHDPVPAEAAPLPRPDFARYEDYFRQSYYAAYSYGSPAQTAATSPASTGVSSPPPPASAFTLPSVGEILDAAKLIPQAPLSVSPRATLSDVSTLAPAAAVSVPTSASPVGLLTNNTPFHLFVTTDPVSAASASASGAPSVGSAGGGSLSSAGGGAASSVGGTVGSVTGTVGSLLHK